MNPNFTLSLSGPSHTLERYDGHKALWLRVIIRAAFDLASYRDDKRLEYKNYANNAKKWLYGPNELFNSFENICVMLQIPIEPIRNWASNLTKDEVQKMEHLERGSSSSPQAELTEVQESIDDTYDEDEFEWP